MRSGWRHLWWPADGCRRGFVAEHKVRVVVQVGPLLCQQRVGGAAAGPSGQKGEDGFGGRGVYSVENLVVEGGTGFEALAGTLGLALLVCAQQIGRIVAQKFAATPEARLTRWGQELTGAITVFCPWGLPAAGR